MMTNATYRALLESLGATWCVVGGKDVVRDYGDIEKEIAALTTLGIANRSERDTVVAAGDDVVPLMQGLVTNNVFLLAKNGSGPRNLAVTINGRIVMDMRLLHVNDMILLDLEPGTVADGRLGHFKKNVINEDARFFDRSGGLIKVAVFGTESASVLATVCSLAYDPARLELFHGTNGASNAGFDVVIQRIDFGEIPAFEVMVLADEAESFLSLLLERDAVRVQQRVARFAVDRSSTLYGAELADDIIPLEADLDSLIDFNKGCYLGQEIIARLDSRGEPAKKLRWFECGSTADQVMVDGKKAGAIVTTIPTGDRFLHAAFIKRDYNELGNVVTVGDETVTLS